MSKIDTVCGTVEIHYLWTGLISREDVIEFIFRELLYYCTFSSYSLHILIARYCFSFHSHDTCSRRRKS